ncbi:monooxygenase, luciferase family [Klebsiella pneumoniae subsp. rhinoscleromatis]|nr:monooxygenase, luciferase family [Klebsiella pneumoniae subsp. rhinoscleromatis]
MTVSPTICNSWMPTLAILSMLLPPWRRDSVLARATDISFQVHSVEPSHRDTLRSIELIAQHIAPHIR